MRKLVISKQMQDIMSAVSVYDSYSQLQVLVQEVIGECQDEQLGYLLEYFANDIQVARIKLEKYVEDKAQFEA